MVTLWQQIQRPRPRITGNCGWVADIASGREWTQEFWRKFEENLNEFWTVWSCSGVRLDQKAQKIRKNLTRVAHQRNWAARKILQRGRKVTNRGSEPLAVLLQIDGVYTELAWRIASSSSWPWCYDERWVCVNGTIIYRTSMVCVCGQWNGQWSNECSLQSWRRSPGSRLRRWIRKGKSP